MYVLAAVTGIRALPDLAQQAVLSGIPGPLFGFLIDRLQHLGKVLEEAAVLLLIVIAFAVLGAVHSWLRAAAGWPHLSLALAAALWLFTMLAILPLAGDGWFGIGSGIAAPLGWALVFLVYVAPLELGQAPPGTGFDPGRRHLLSWLPLGIGLSGGALLALRLLPGWWRAVLAPPEQTAATLSPAITPVASFYVVSKNFQDPVVAAANWRLSVKGLVERSLTISYRDLRTLPSRNEYATLECISNNVGGSLMSTGLFTGVSLRDIIASASPKPEAETVAFRAHDGYIESLPLSMALGAPEILVAYALDEAPLPTAHGFPARILIPGHYGMKGPKWVDAIELLAGQANGYWEDQGWDRAAVVKTTARIDLPRQGDLLPRAPTQVGGVAFAGTRGISAVEWSQDGGRSWHPATFEPPLSPLTWVIWQTRWSPVRSGSQVLAVRARDGAGNLQSSANQPSFPSGATGYHMASVLVS